MHHWRRAALTAIAAALTACGGSADSGYGNGPTTNPTPPQNPGTPSPVATNSVTLTDATFDPTNIAVHVGATVTWQWNSCSDTYGGYSTCVSHQIVFDDGSGIMSDKQSTGSFVRVFNTAGTYKYHCAVHGAPMSGQITVQ